ncbi:MAG: (Fe-S)-binding protein [Gammaproteobacteria bacterium]
MDELNIKQSLVKTIQEKSDQCVRCGLCIPHCPTYHISAIECESPRGRIALFNAYANNSIQASDKMRTYLDHCLSCNSCEAVCPSEVQYNDILTAGRTLLTMQGDATPIPYSVKMILRLAKSTLYPILYKLFCYLLYFYQISKLQTLFRKIKLLKLFKLARIDSYLTNSISLHTLKGIYPSNNCIGSVGLLTGCITQLLDTKTLLATIKLLNHYGYDVHLPKNQVCCGALHKHAGFESESLLLFKQNNLAFNHLETIITIASGCGASLQQTAHKKNFPTIMDPLAFLAKQKKHPLFKPLTKKIAIHIPCTLKNVLQQDSGVIELLKNIPECEITILKTSYCCGAAGTNMIQHESNADKLADELINEILEITPDIVVTSNIGCQLQLLQRAKTLGKSFEIVHPCILLASCI